MAPDMFCNFYFVKSYKIANKSATTSAREKLSTYLESLKFFKHFDACLTKFENETYQQNTDVLTMSLFHPINILVVSRNWWLIVKFDCF